tara:strand:+ start:60 stop:485 length:426 start_codon:yes stop_codon:yes gene_type:complete
MKNYQEFPTDPLAARNILDKRRVRPETQIQALMEIAPNGSDPEPSVQDFAILREVVGRAIDNLFWEDRAIFEGIFIWGLSLRQTGAALGIPKTTVARRRDRIRKLLIAELSQSPAIQHWLRKDSKNHSTKPYIDEASPSAT